MADDRFPSRRPALLAACSIALLLTACTVEPGTMPGDVSEPLALPAPPQPTPGFGLLTDHGVALDPCPRAANPDNGCIRLGALVDTSGPFGPRDEAALAGAQAFWQHVNDEGGVTHKPEDGIEAAFDVDLDTFVEDAASPTTTHLDAFDEIEPDVLALALSTSVTATVELLPRLQQAEMATVPLDVWSGWEFEPLVAESGANACLQALDGLDWALAETGGDITDIDHVVAVHTTDEVGQDVLAGVERWSDPDAEGGDPPRVPFEPTDHAVEVEPDGEVTEAVDLIDDLRPEIAVLAVSPDQLATIATETADRGWDGLLVGTASTYEPSILDDPTVAESLDGRLVRVGTVGPLTQGGEAYIDMRTSLGLGEDRQVDADDGRIPPNDAWIAGWVSQYPLHLALKEAIAAGDLTRAGFVHELEALTVRYDGALPDTRYAGDPNAQMTRRSFVSHVDPSGLLGLRLVGDAYVGRTAERMTIDRPCTEE